MAVPSTPSRGHQPCVLTLQGGSRGPPGPRRAIPPERSSAWAGWPLRGGRPMEDSPEPDMPRWPMGAGRRPRVVVSIVVFVGWLIFLLLFAGFWAQDFSFIQSIIIILVSALVGIAILGAGGASGGRRFRRGPPPPPRQAWRRTRRAAPRRVRDA